MKTDNILQALDRAGLGANEAKTYVALLRTGSSPVSRLVKETSLRRTTLYDALACLVEKGLASSYVRGATTVFSAEHPRSLETFLDKKAQGVKTARQAVSAAMPEMMSLSHPALMPPTLKMFEGIEGIRKVLFGSLDAKETIYTYVSVDDMDAHIREVNAEYLAERVRRKVQKKALVLDTPYARAMLAKYDTTATEFRLFSQGGRRFHCEMNVYDGKIEYLTYQPGRLMGTVIEEADLAAVQRMAFENLWLTAKVLPR